MKKIIIIFLTFFTFTFSVVNAQSLPTLYSQSGEVVDGFNSNTQALNAGWYYTEDGSPRYYYENGVYYDPSDQSYGGSVVFPSAPGPQINNAGMFTPGVPETGIGNVMSAWLAIITSAIIAFFGTIFLTRSKPNEKK